jgi:hypothetical protein
MATEITEQIVREAPQIEAYKLGLLEAAKAQIARPMDLPAYQVAGMAPEQVEAAQLAKQGIGAYAPFMTQAGQAVKAGIGALGYGTQMAAQLPQFATAAGTGMPSVQQGITTLGQAAGNVPGATMGYNPNMAQAFMNPYQQQVTERALTEMRRQADIARQGQAAQAVRAGAFGGTREGVQRAEFERGLQDVMSQRIAQDLAANYAQAQQAGMAGFEAQQQRQLSGAGLLGQMGTQQAQMGLLPAQIAAQQANILGTGAQLYGSLGQGLGSLGVQQGALGESAQRAGQSDVNMLFNLGEQQRQISQQGLEAQRATQLQRTMAPYQQLGFLSDIYKGAPSSSMAITGQSAPTTSPLLQAASLGIGALSAATGAQKAGLFGP